MVHQHLHFKHIADGNCVFRAARCGELASCGIGGRRNGIHQVAYVHILAANDRGELLVGQGHLLAQIQRGTDFSFADLIAFGVHGGGEGRHRGVGSDAACEGSPALRGRMVGEEALQFSRECHGIARPYSGASFRGPPTGKAAARLATVGDAPTLSEYLEDWKKRQTLADNVCGQDRRQIALLTGHGNFPPSLYGS
jgi:hypothetical protein